MELYPAIDIRGGRVVRLTEGDYDRVSVYEGAPAETARRFKDCGAKYLHVVDLDGAKDGAAANFEVIREVVKVGLFTEVGGGIRDAETIDRYLNIGVSRVILGTSATDFDFLRDVLARFGDKIAVGVDARNGLAAVRGWKEDTKLDAVTFAVKIAEMGVKTIIYTDISRDGALNGVNFPIYQQLSETLTCALIASGGVTTPDDIRALKTLNIHGAILGKALYEGRIDLKEALKC
ncbi:1-(5-phosphoribosyl)-5-[(5-phosphoribosylamino) methylideneamino] imidazole-4-carboxamide isomerase [Clostridia bacterium]|nr:1-(5-phosphoribosyl)-5-[(5-phosphoribosylamino) methylideneamino] imidazole-4-carboxamide isomerase [Clostridia bacterium]